MEALLDPDERARARSALRPGLRRRFVLAHAGTRILLGARLGRPPEQLRFRRGRWGKPAVVDASGLHFSLSHSGELALLAVAPRPVGVDVELVRSGRDVDRLSRRFFPCPERELVARGGRPAFARLWTRKEACVKASGGRLTEGLALPVAHTAAQATVHAPPPTGAVPEGTVPVGPLPDGPLPDGPAGPWRVADLPLPGEPEPYAGAVALLGDGAFAVSWPAWPEPTGWPARPGATGRIGRTAGSTRGGRDARTADGAPSTGVK
ncbi:4'-phosphopantetheinyl transferase superfamily protein [Kitasatospora sp. NPDC089797]|uniref:4'-phosphopantetheinyl transferase family protein n=1 Tax=Kitasatospora sp. NPDC089797 TaxID=3155298 RepID=UPI003416BB6A